MEAINVQWDKNILELENTYLQQHEQLVDTKFLFYILVKIWTKSYDEINISKL